MRTTFVEILIQRARQDKSIQLVTGDLGFGVLQPFIDQLPQQYTNAGVAEQNMMAMAGGMASVGLVPVVYSIGNFPTLRCYEQIRNDVCYYNANVKIICIGGGFTYGALGMSHHATEDIAIMRALPRMHVFTPSDRIEARFLINLMFDIKAPVYLRLERDSLIDLHRPNYEFKLGAPALMSDNKAESAIIAYGTISKVALDVSAKVNEQGYKLDAYSMPSLKPIDNQEMIEVLKKYKIVYTLEEHNIIGGLASIVSEIIARNNLNVRLIPFAINDKLCSDVGDQEYLRKANEINFESVYMIVIKNSRQ